MISPLLVKNHLRTSQLVRMVHEMGHNREARKNDSDQGEEDNYSNREEWQGPGRKSKKMSVDFSRESYVLTPDQQTMMQDLRYQVVMTLKGLYREVYED